LPDQGVEALEALPRPDVDGLRWTTRDQWHVTLRFLGDVEDVDAAASALDDVDQRATVAALGPSTARFGRRVLHVPVAGLDGVASAVVHAMAGIGQRPEDRPFRGHVTLARARGRRGVDLRPLVGMPVHAAWPVSEVVLYESHLHPRGARYAVRSRVSLRVAGS
jgi:2'-5' RNA ligase